MSQANRGIRHAINSWIPNWLSNRADKNVGFRILYTIALHCDAVVETMLQGLRAAWPGKGTPTALPYIGGSRGLIRGLTESDDDYAARLRAYLTTWENAADDSGLIRLLQIYLGGNLAMRIVNRRGQFVSISTSGVVTKTTNAGWDWDSLTPGRTDWWSDLWIVVYLDSRWPVYTDLTDSNWIAAWGRDDLYGVGQQVPREAVDGVKQIIQAFKGAHTWLQAIVWTTDLAVMNPADLTQPGNPSGDWAYWSKLDGGNNQVPARTISIGPLYNRFWIPTQGG